MDMMTIKIIQAMELGDEGLTTNTTDPPNARSR